MPVATVVRVLHVYPKPGCLYGRNQVVVGFFTINLNKVKEKGLMRLMFQQKDSLFTNTNQVFYIL